MSIFQKIVLRGLHKNRTRTVVTVIGVALAALLLTAITTFAVSLQDYMVRGAEEKYGNWQVELPAADETQVQAQQQNTQVTKTTVYTNIGYAKLANGKNPDKPYLFVAAFDDTCYQTLPVHLLSGRLPQNDTEVLIPAHLSSNGGVEYALGDTITLQVGSRIMDGRQLNQKDAYQGDGETLKDTVKKTYRIVGICQRPSFELRSAPGYTLITGDGQGMDGLSKSLFVTLKQPQKVRQYIKTAGLDEGAYILNDEVLRFYGVSEDNMFNMLLYSVVAVLAALIMIGSVFLIYNSFHMSMNERMQQYGILMSVGATEKQLRHSVLFEGICVGCIGIPIGMVIGIPSVKLVLSLTQKNFSNILYANVPLRLCISTPALVAAVVLSLCTILISAAIPARKAMKTPIMECIRQSNEIQMSKKAVKISRFSEYWLNLEGALALKNFKRNRRRYRSVILSLTMSVVLFVAANAFTGDLRQISGDQTGIKDYNVSAAMTGADAEQINVGGVGELSAEELAAAHELIERNQNMVFVINLFSAVFIFMMTLIAVANVFNTISTNIRLRRRELAMLRSVGMSDRNFNRMMRVECWFYGIRTMLYGIPLSIGLSWLIYMGLDAGGGELNYQIPLQSLCVSLGSVLLIIFITMFYATSKLKNENIIDALRDDNI